MKLIDKIMATAALGVLSSATLIGGVFGLEIGIGFLSVFTLMFSPIYLDLRKDYK